MTVELINPDNGRRLEMVGERLIDGAGAAFPIVGGIPRFCDPSNYTDNFGKQWNAFRLTQIDREIDGQELSRRRFFAETAWTPAELDGAELLEVGSGAGRFTQVVLQHTRARLTSLDYSSAVDANWQTNGPSSGGRLTLVQGSIYDMPFPDASFDKVFCLGVLQHTPSFEGSIKALVSKAKRGGEIVVDFYPIRGWWTKASAKYWLRPITRRMPHDRLLKLIRGNVGWMSAVQRTLIKSRLGALGRFLPMVDLRTLPQGLSREELREWIVLDTFDMFSPEYDNPQRVEDVAAMFRRAGAEVIFAGFVDAGPAQSAVVRAIRR